MVSQFAGWGFARRGGNGNSLGSGASGEVDWRVCVCDAESRCVNGCAFLLMNGAS